MSFFRIQDLGLYPINDLLWFVSKNGKYWKGVLLTVVLRLLSSWIQVLIKVCRQQVLCKRANIFDSQSCKILWLELPQCTAHHSPFTSRDWLIKCEKRVFPHSKKHVFQPRWRLGACMSISRMKRKTQLAFAPRGVWHASLIEHISNSTFSTTKSPLGWDRGTWLRLRFKRSSTTNNDGHSLVPLRQYVTFYSLSFPEWIHFLTRIVTCGHDW